jgi:glutamine amidotransferase
VLAIIDYGMGNLHSIYKALVRNNFKATITSDIEEISKADKIILPGVGSFARGMFNLANLGIAETLNRKVLNDKTPVLGICLGLQLMTRRSEEGGVDGLGWIDCHTIRFKFDKGRKLKVPHVGWNDIKKKDDCRILKNIPPEAHFYFVHSYHLPYSGESFVAATTNYGHEFTSVVHMDNIFGTQFHPEKSHKTGHLILKNFMEET